MGGEIIIINTLNLRWQLRRGQQIFSRKLMKCLEELKNTDYSNCTLAEASSCTVENARNLLLQVGRKRVNFTESDEGQMGLMLLDIVKPVPKDLFLSPPLPSKEKILSLVPTKEELVECLQDMIDYIEYSDPIFFRGKNSVDLISQVGENQKNFTEKFVKCIEELKNTDYSKFVVADASNQMVNNFLHLLFEVCRERINFTEEEQRQIGNLLVDVIKPIQMNVVFSCFRPRFKLDNSVFVKRSILQYLIEDYGQFPARSSTLKNELEKANIKHSIAILDALMEGWGDDADPDLDEVEMTVPLGMPDTHTWWPK